MSVVNSLLRQVLKRGSKHSVSLGLRYLYCSIFLMWLTVLMKEEQNLAGGLAREAESRS